MAEKLATYDPAKELDSDEAIAFFMAEAFETNDPATSHMRLVSLHARRG